MSDNMATVKSVISKLGSVAAGAMVTRSIVNDFLPHEVHDYLYSIFHTFFSRRIAADISVVINEFNGLQTNEIFEAAELYLGSRTKLSSSTSLSSGQRLRASKLVSEKTIQVNVDQNEVIVDEYLGVNFRWILQCKPVETKGFYNPRDVNGTALRSEARSFLLTFSSKVGKEMAIDKYLPYILEVAVALEQEQKTTKLHTLDTHDMYGPPGSLWNSSVNLNHPANFDTLAMDPELKKMIIDDLDRFVKRKDYYRKVGKAWKRGYLLYGPPGTGKSSLIAAIANYLNFDIYDLQLSALRYDANLRKVLIGTGNRSILVVEDIDCSVNLKNRNIEVELDEGEDEDMAEAQPEPYSQNQRQNEKVTLSGMLNFIDGLWSSCGDERIIIFTTNHKDKLDPALLRPGRMDVHIHMSYCTASGFKVLAMNYLGVQSHELFEDIEGLIDHAEATPAEVAEQLIKHDDTDSALVGLVEFLRKKIAEKAAKAEAKAGKLKRTQQALKVHKKIDKMKLRKR